MKGKAISKDAESSLQVGGKGTQLGGPEGSVWTLLPVREGLGGPLKNLG